MWKSILTPDRERRASDDIIKIGENIMRQTIIVVLILIILSTVIGEARPGNDPNAAVRYLMALGSLPDVLDKHLDIIDKTHTVDDFGKFDKETRAVLDHPKVAMAMTLLKAGAACPECNFTPDDRGLYSDMIPPYRRIRQFARLARAYAWKCEQEGNLEEAASVLTSVFMLGQHVEENGVLISTMIGIAVRKIAVVALQEMRTRHPQFDWQKTLVPFFAKIPRPAANIKVSLAYERQGIENSLRLGKTRPEIFDKDLVFLAPPLMITSLAKDSFAGKPDLPRVPVSTACRERQRGLLAGVERLQKDIGRVLPATMSADLRPSLAGSGYVSDEVFTCPGSGAISLTPITAETYQVTCSLHGVPQATDTVDLNAEPTVLEPLALSNEVKQALTTAYIKSIAATPEYDRQLKEAMKFYEDLLALEPTAPDFIQRARAIQESVYRTKNIFAWSLIPSFDKAQEQANILQKEIDDLLK